MRTRGYASSYPVLLSKGYFRRLTFAPFTVFIVVYIAIIITFALQAAFTLVMFISILILIIKGGSVSVPGGGGCLLV